MCTTLTPISEHGDACTFQRLLVDVFLRIKLHRPSPKWPVARCAKRKKTPHRLSAGAGFLLSCSLVPGVYQACASAPHLALLRRSGSPTSTRPMPMPIVVGAMETRAGALQK